MNLLQDFLSQWARLPLSELQSPLNRENDEELEAMIESFQKELSHELSHKGGILR